MTNPLNKELEEWNKEIESLEALILEQKTFLLQQKKGLMRSILVGLLRFNVYILKRAKGHREDILHGDD